jgi:hypothetical protein
MTKKEKDREAKDWNRAFLLLVQVTGLAILHGWGDWAFRLNGITGGGFGNAKNKKS